jgi:GWxTD domain-containing protein
MEKIKNILFIFNLSLLFYLFTAGSILADNKFQFGFDYSIFKGSTDKAIVEIYYSFYQKGLIYKFEDNEYVAAGRIEISILKEGTNDTLFSSSYKVPSKVSDTSGAILEQKLVGQLTYQIPYGNYRLEIVGMDFNDNSNSDSIQIALKIIPFDDLPQISDIEFATSIKKSSNSENIFYKNTLEVIPNPSGLYGNNVEKLFYYFEIYGLEKEKISDDFSIISVIADRNKNEIYKKKKNIKTVPESIAEYGFFMVDSLPTGSYILVINLKDTLNDVDLTKERKFYIYNPNVTIVKDQTGDEEFLKSEYINMREELINEDFAKSLYIRTENETKIFEGLTNLDQKRKFLYNFWKTRDDQPSTPQNEFKLIYLLRVIEANKLFKESFIEGWRTDRGRIYIIYGKPDLREVYPFESNSKGYEIWNYDVLEGGAMCVFIEMHASGSGAYELEHSTLRNELRNDDWKSIIGKDE